MNDTILILGGLGMMLIVAPSMIIAREISEEGEVEPDLIAWLMKQPLQRIYMFSASYLFGMFMETAAISMTAWVRGLRALGHG